MTQKSTKSTFFVKCLGSKGPQYMCYTIVVILLLLLGFYLHKKLQYTKFELESCRSSNTSSSE
jgi:hypothetical protein